MPGGSFELDSEEEEEEEGTGQGQAHHAPPAQGVGSVLVHGAGQEVLSQGAPATKPGCLGKPTQMTPQAMHHVHRQILQPCGLVAEHLLCRRQRGGGGRCSDGGGGLSRQQAGGHPHHGGQLTLPRVHPPRRRQGQRLRVAGGLGLPRGVACSHQGVRGQACHPQHPGCCGGERHPPPPPRLSLLHRTPEGWFHCGGWELRLECAPAAEKVGGGRQHARVPSQTSHSQRHAAEGQRRDAEADQGALAGPQTHMQPTPTCIHTTVHQSAAPLHFHGLSWLRMA